jgi:stress response protein YsnF
MKKVEINALWAATALASVLVLCGCHSSKSNAKYSYSTPPAAGGTGTGAAKTSGSAMGPGEQQLVVPLYEEKVKIGKREVDAGGIRIRKHVTTETMNEPMQLRQETLTVERLPAEAQDASGKTAAAAPQGSQLGTPFEAGEIVIRLQKEEPLVDRQMTQTGRIVAQKKSSTKQVTVKENVRHEQVDVAKVGNPEGVTIPENLQAPEAVGGTPATGGQETGAGSSGQITDLNQLSSAKDKSALEGREVRLSNARVHEVLSDRIFTVGDENAQAVIQTQEPLQNIQPGDQVNVSGQVHQFTPSSSALKLMKTQKVYVEVPRVEKAGQ